MSPACPQCGSTALPVNGVCPSCVARTLAASLLDLAPEPLPSMEALAIELDGYEVHELVGGGGMGEVYRATRLSDSRTVAIKLVAARLTRDPEVTARFEQEVSTMAQMDHPCVANVLDQGETRDGRHFLVSEFIDGCDLRRLMRAQTLSLEESFSIFEKVCAGIAHAHARGIVHRDIKPANILIGKDGTVKVADFGLAKTLADESQHYGFTATRDTFGTPYYIAPEVTRQATQADERADVYALGVLLYEMLAGTVPMGQFTPLSKRIDVDSHIDYTIARALADDPIQRTASVEKLATEVHAIAQRQTARHRRSRLLVIGSISLTILILGAVIGALWTRPPAQAPRPSYPRPSTASKAQPWTNGLGMTFVPSPQKGLLVATHETSLAAFQVFMKDFAAGLPEWRQQIEAPKRVTSTGKVRNTPWFDPGFPQTPEHPVCCVDLIRSRIFCAWLTSRERNEGRLTPAEAYRLPTDDEWSLLARADGSSWEQDDAEAQANFAGIEGPEAPGWPEGAEFFPRRDPFPRTAPIGSFKPNALGLYDLFGNVAEWVDTPGKDESTHYLRGGSWTTGVRRHARPAFQLPAPVMRSQPNFGFRVVLVVEQ